MCNFLLDQIVTTLSDSLKPLQLFQVRENFEIFRTSEMHFKRVQKKKVAVNTTRVSFSQEMSGKGKKVSLRKREKGEG